MFAGIVYIDLFRGQSYQNLTNLNHGVKRQTERTADFVSSLRQPFDRRPFSAKYYYA